MKKLHWKTGNIKPAFEKIYIFGYNYTEFF